MDNSELLHESFDYDNFFSENSDDYHRLTYADTIQLSTNENLVENTSGTLVKHRATGTRNDGRRTDRFIDSPLGNILMDTVTDDYFSSGAQLTHGQVIKTEGTTSYFNGNANQYNSNQPQQTFTYENVVYNTTGKILIHC